MVDRIYFRPKSDKRNVMVRVGHTKENENEDQKETRMFENLNSDKETETKEPEMFEESNSEEDFEIPAFLRRQKN